MTTKINMDDKLRRHREAISSAGDAPFSKRLRMLLKDQRLVQGLRQEDAARAADISREALLRFESGRADMRIETIDKLLAGLGVTIEFNLVPVNKAPDTNPVVLETVVASLTDTLVPKVATP